MHPRTALAALLLVTAVLAAGCASLGLGDGPDPDALREDVVATNASLDGYRADYVLSIDGPNVSTTSRATLLVDRPDRVLLRYRAPANSSGDVFLRNATSTRFYDSSENRVTLLGEPTQPVVDPVESYVRMLTADEAAFSGRTEGEGGVELGYAAGGTNVSVEFGGGPGASRFDVAGDANATTRTVYVDPELELPVRMEVRTNASGDVYDVTYRLENLTLDPDLDPAAFSLEAPPDATVEDRSNVTRSYEDPAALDAATELPVVEPDVPEGYELQDATLLTVENGSTAILGYINGSMPDPEGFISVTVTSIEGTDMRAVSGQVDLGPTIGTVTTQGETVTVEFALGDVEFTVAGTAGEETVVEVARSVAQGAVDEGAGRERGEDDGEGQDEAETTTAAVRSPPKPVSPPPATGGTWHTSLASVSSR